MASLLNQLLKKAGGQRESKKLSPDEVECISNEAALQLRGGDKDYSPTYDHSAVPNDRFPNPSILLDF